MKKTKFGYDIMTVAELIEALKSMPQEAEVWHEGCDCTGAANGVRLDDDGSVMITRSN
jgi:hypothetical protein